MKGRQRKETYSLPFSAESLILLTIVVATYVPIIMYIRVRFISEVEGQWEGGVMFEGLGGNEPARRRPAPTKVPTAIKTLPPSLPPPLIVVIQCQEKNSETLVRENTQGNEGKILYSEIVEHGKQHTRSKLHNITCAFSVPVL